MQSTVPSKDTLIYVAGHRGLVGSAVVRALHAHGYHNLVLRTHAELELLDQAATRAFFATERPELVILAAARVGGIWANFIHPFEFAADNLAMDLNIIEAAFRNGVRRLLFMGSSCIYPRDALQPLKEEYLLTGPLEETNRPYAVAKIAGIELCRSLNREYGTEYLSLMPTNLYGPGDNFDLSTAHVLPALIRRLHEAKTGPADEQGRDRPRHPPVTLWGTGEVYREFLHVDDLGEATVCVMERGSVTDLPDGMVNVGVGADLTVRELAVLVQRAVGHEGEIRWDTTMPDGTPRKLLDVSRIQGFGWRPSIDLEQGIRMTYQWYQEHHER
ncbi:MAG: GDP-fucose synthetase [Acidobacteria bacterium RBG_16_64_8]|nr:MAG: GDP-fucose synthetase [Acidobacteria bacterium RBG_16_64_8]